SIVSGPIPELVHARSEVNHGAALAQQIPVVRAHHCAATRRQHYIRKPGQLLEHRSLARAKSRLAFELKDDRNAHPGSFFDYMVRIVKRFAQPAGEEFTYRRLPRAHHAHEKDICRVRSRDALVSCSFSVGW